MTKKLFSVFTILFVSTLMLHAQVAQQLDNAYTTYGKPILISLCIIFIIYGGLANMNDIRAGGEQAKKAIGSFFMLVIWPIILLGIAEIARNLIN
jgi:predicted Na+-dependent transporter